jgi:ubiquinone/menaquinone biosynthesis C-methylase UbiE
MRDREVTRYRSEIVPQARGVVVELGIGSGLNLPFYSGEVTQLHAVDPSPELVRMAVKRRHEARFPVEFLVQSAEALPFAGASVDTVLTTFTLCSIPDALRALREAKRVLKPGGRLLFAEHGLAPEARVRRWQQRLNPLWKRIAGGCNLDREIDALVRDAGFSLPELRNEYARGPKPLAYIYVGAATA